MHMSIEHCNFRRVIYLFFTHDENDCSTKWLQFLDTIGTIESEYDLNGFVEKYQNDSDFISLKGLQTGLDTLNNNSSIVIVYLHSFILSTAAICAKSHDFNEYRNYELANWGWQTDRSIYEFNKGTLTLCANISDVIDELSEPILVLKTIIAWYMQWWF